MRSLYLALAVLGTAVPYALFVPYFMEADTTLGSFLQDAFVNKVASGLSGDLVISSVVFWIWSFRESKRLQLSRWWVYLVLNLGVGLSCALPLFLYVRSGRTEA